MAVLHEPPLTDVKLKALGIAASVFAQLTTYNTPRELKEFRDSCDIIFKALGLDAIDWEETDEAL